MAHRDIKPESCFLDLHGYLKLGGFGFAREVLPGTRAMTPVVVRSSPVRSAVAPPVLKPAYSPFVRRLCGSPEYLAPECVLNRGHGRAVDYWGLGVLIYELQTSTTPFANDDVRKTYQMIVQSKDALTFPGKFSTSCIHPPTNSRSLPLARQLPAALQSARRGAALPKPAAA